MQSASLLAHNRRTAVAAQIGFNEPDFDQNPYTANLRAVHKELERARKIAGDGIVGFNIMVAMKNYEGYVREAVSAGADIILKESI